MGRSSLLGAGLLVVLVILGLGTQLDGLDDHARARRLLLWHGVVCEPKIVDRQDGDLRVVCAEGKHELTAEPLCDESWPCLLGIDVACWDYAPAG